MRLPIIIFAILLSFSACKNEPSAKNTKPQKEEELKTIPSAESKKDSKKLAQKCAIKGGFLIENLKAIKNNQFLVILADESTKDPKFGESHRVLLVKDKDTCEDLFRQTLPINKSPDFPYYIADINYNNTNALVAIKGYDQIYCYDINQKELQPALSPTFANEREAQDAQSGQIKHLELWEDYIIGHALDYGSFVFTIQKDGAIQATLPYAEYSPQGVQNYASLFVLESNNGWTQLLLPSYDKASGQFSLNPLLGQPSKMDKSKSIISKDKRYLLFVEKESNQTIVIDLKKQKRIDLSPEQGKLSPIQIMTTLTK